MPKARTQRIKLSNVERLIFTSTGDNTGTVQIKPDPRKLPGKRGYSPEKDDEYNAAVDGFLTTVLSIGCAGLDLEAYQPALESCWEQLHNHYD